MKRRILLSLLLIGCVTAHAQEEDQEERYYETRLNTGLFLSLQDFKDNSPIRARSIVTDFNPNERNFYFNLLKEKEVQITSPDSDFSIRPSRIWGYFDGKGLFLNRKLFPLDILNSRDASDHLWAQVIDIGKICLVYYNKNFKSELDLRPGFGGKRNKEMTFLYNIDDGYFFKAKAKNLEHLIQDDPEVYDEFQNYRGDDEEKLYIFLRKYNRRNILELPY